MSEELSGPGIGTGESLFESSFDMPQHPSRSAYPDYEPATEGDSAESPAKTIITIRALLSSKEAGAIIGKGGHNVAELRDLTGVRAGVSKPVEGVSDRVLTVTGSLDGVSRAYAMAAQTLVDNPTAGATPVGASGVTTARLLIPHQQMGSVIGRQGVKIKTIQEAAHVRMVASKEMLPQSTERVVEIQGVPDAIRAAVWEVGQCLLEDWERAAGSILYAPQTPNSFHGFAGYTTQTSPTGTSRNSSSPAQSSYQGSSRGSTGTAAPYNGDSQFQASSSFGEEGMTYQEISIPADMVGCIIGKKGTKIQEIRRESGARISIAKQAVDDSGERLFTIRGTPTASERALQMLYVQLEMEKSRRSEELA